MTDVVSIQESGDKETVEEERGHIFKSKEAIKNLLNKPDWHSFDQFFTDESDLENVGLIMALSKSTAGK